MKIERNFVPTILLAVAGVAALIGIGVWIYAKQMTIGSLLAFIAAILCAGVAIYLQPEPVRAATATRQVQQGGNVLVMSILLVAILVVVNMILNPNWPRPSWLSWLPSFEKQWDLTSSQQYSISQDTISILKSVNQPVTILAFYSSQADQSSRLLLENYAHYNKLITLQWVDPVVDPLQAQKYGVTYDGTVVLQAGDRKQTATPVDEVGLTSALLKVLRTSQSVVYFTTGHGERPLSDTSDQGFSEINSALENSGYQVRTLTTAVTTTIPSDASAVIIAGPGRSFTASEADMLKAYLARGGKLMLMFDVVDATQQPDPLFGLGPILSEWGVAVRNAVVVDAGQSLASNLERVYIAPAVVQYGSSPITSKLDGQTSVFMLTRSISQTSQIAGVQYTALAQSSSDSWDVTDLAEVQTAVNAHTAPQPGKQDVHGPLTLAASLENSQTHGQLVIFGTSSFASNPWVNATAGRDLFLGAANWLTTQPGGQEFSLPPKNSTVRQMQPLTLDQILGIGFVSVILLPLGMAAAGILVWWRRR